MSGWTLSHVFEAHARKRGDAPALAHEDEVVSWAQMDRRARAIAGALSARGLQPGDRVALVMHNRTEYLQIVHALSLGAFVHVNVNYRYRAHEMLHVLGDSGAAAVFYDDLSAPAVGEARDLLGSDAPRTWVLVGAGDAPVWSERFDDIVADEVVAAAAWERLEDHRSGDDLFLIYTGGTTGAPKGVMWRQHDLIGGLARRAFGNDVAALPDEVDLAWLDRACSRSPVTGLAASPLMHATALLRSVVWLLGGGQSVTVGGAHLDPAHLLDTIERRSVQELALVGDAFARPLLDALAAQPGRWDLSGVRRISSAGVIWSQSVKRHLLELLPDVVLMDALGSSEAVGMAVAESTRDHPDGSFVLGPTACVLDADNHPLQGPGTGRIAVGGHVPLGYRNDPKGSATTFPVIDGVRHSAPGDLVTVEVDGRITLVGRGSACINTGGEKVFPEEVEAVVLLHPAIADAVVVGTPDERFGEVVTAVVSLRAGHGLEPDAMREFVANRLAAYKAPRRTVIVSEVRRGPHGKADYPAMRRAAMETLDDSSSSP